MNAMWLGMKIAQNLQSIGLVVLCILAFMIVGGVFIYVIVCFLGDCADQIEKGID